MAPIKICHLIKPSTHNPLLFNSIKFSDRERFEYTVVSLDAVGALHDQMDELQVRSLSLNRPSRKQLPQTFIELARLFRRDRFDILQVHGFEASLAGLPPAVIAQVPNRLFSGHHSHEVPLHKNWKLLQVDSLLASRLSTHVIAPSQNMRDIFVDALDVPARKVVVIPHGIDVNEWSPGRFTSSPVRTQMGIPSGAAVVGAVGRLYWVKGFDLLIRAFADVAVRHTDVVLWIIGDGAERTELTRLADALGLSKRIFFLGSRDDISAVAAEMNVAIHSSFAESFGLVFVEAMALGKPVIGTAVGIAPELIRDGENGFLVEPYDGTALSKAIEKILNLRPEWPRMERHARKSAERYSVAITQSQCDDFYASLVN